jgi:hypothetical protein
VPRENPRDSRYKISLRPPFLKPWSKRDPGKNGVREPSCFSDLPTFLPFVQHFLGSKSRATDRALYTILPKVACHNQPFHFSQFQHVSAPTWNSLHGHFVSAAIIFVYTPTRMDGYAARFFVIPLPLSSSYCRSRSSNFPVLHFLYMVHSHADRRKLRRENTHWPSHSKSYIGVYRMIQLMFMFKL